MKYRQLNAEERRALAVLRTLRLNQAAIVRQLDRHRSAIGRELKASGILHRHLRL